MLVPFSGPALGVLADRFSVSEEQGRGWQGSVAIDIGPGRKLPLSDSLDGVMSIGLAPESSFVLSLVVGSGMGAGLVVRNWPCVVSSVETVARRKGQPADSVCHVRFSDPLGHLAQRPVWGRLREVLPGRDPRGCAEFGGRRRRAARLRPANARDATGAHRPVAARRAPGGALRHRRRRGAGELAGRRVRTARRADRDGGASVRGRSS